MVRLDWNGMESDGIFMSVLWYFYFFVLFRCCGSKWGMELRWGENWRKHVHESTSK